MALWVPQSETPSVTAAARTRTAYLQPVLEETIDAISEYMATSPDGEEVMLAVLKSIGESRLKQLAVGRSFDRVKQDLGVLVAMTLVDLFGAMQVETWRRDDRRAVSSRRVTWPELSWIATYTPHRVITAQRAVPRIFLDTSSVRKVIHGDADAIDLTELSRAKGIHPVSIADGALPELAAALLRNSVSPAKWAARVGALDAVLDPDFPVAPGGKELAAFWGAHPMVGLDLGEVRAYYRAAWTYLRQVQDKSDLTRQSVFHAPSGRAYAIQLDPEHVERVLAEAGQRWQQWVSGISALIRDARKRGEVIDEEGLRSVTRSNLLLDMGVADANKLDLVIHVLARRAFNASASKDPYSPKGKPNDPLDLDLLFGIPLPGVVCTDDNRMVKLIRSTESKDRDKVMAPAELLAWLSRGIAAPSAIELRSFPARRMCRFACAASCFASSEALPPWDLWTGLEEGSAMASITCPSGLTGSIRGLKVREERVLADRKIARAGSVVDELLRACWEQTNDPGPYDFGAAKIDWDKVLQGDRFFALIQIRALTYGPDYAFAVTCREDGCRARIEWELDLRQLPVRPLSEESRASFLAGNRFETRLPDAGQRCWFRLLTGADEKKLPALRRNAGDRMLSAMLGFRVVEVEGVEDRERRRFLEELSMRDADFLVDEFDRVDCGVDTTIEIECPECFARQDVQLPFDQRFFLPGKGRTARRRGQAGSSPA